MRLGSTQALFSGYGEQCYRKMKAFGFDYADVSIPGELHGTGEEAYVQRWLNEKKRAEEAGVTIHQVHGPWRYPPHDETEELRAGRAEVMKRSIRITGMLGCRYWVIHPMMPYGPDDDFNLDSFLEINRQLFRSLLPVARENNVVICLENMPMKRLTISTPEKTLEFIREFQDDHFGFCLDTGHCAVHGIQPAAAVRMAKNDLKVLHLHDNYGSKDDHLLPYTGVIDWADFRLALDEIGFDGVLSMENGMNSFLPNAPTDVRFACLREVVGSLARL